jgi:hypothetical protein
MLAMILLSSLLWWRDGAGYPNALYYTNLAVPEVFYIITNPTAGKWQLVLSEGSGIPIPYGTAPRQERKCLCGRLSWPIQPSVFSIETTMRSLPFVQRLVVAQ